MSPLASAFLNAGLFLASGKMGDFVDSTCYRGVLCGVYSDPRLKKTRIVFFYLFFFKEKTGTHDGIGPALLSAMAMTMSSGMDTDSSLEMAEKLCEDYTLTYRKISECRERLQSGQGFCDTITETELFSPLFCRMLDIGVKDRLG